MPKAPIKVAVTGAAGQIGYALLFRIASGAMFGPDQPVILQLIEAPFEKALQALQGVAMELDDCAFPLLKGIVQTSDPAVGFKDANWCLSSNQHERDGSLIAGANDLTFDAVGYQSMRCQRSNWQQSGIA